MKVHIANDQCVGAGQCVLSAPEVFDQKDDDGTVMLLDDRPAEAVQGRVRDAAHLCPAGVIEVDE
ncbi:MAG TPA: ferredoxin [Pseudonocardiaceae bacterium]|nr:ferredoxin [Pseudonocardiaceae bacterium]